MKRFVLLLCLFSGAAHAASWSDLWVTRDDRRRAYEEIQAGEYAGAAKRLEPFKDPQSQYNRGNALARGGKLENAVAAYDDAIKQTPADSELGRDARHNRDLVAEQLKKQQSQQQQQQQQGQQGQQNPSSGQKQDAADAKRDAESATAQAKQDENAKAKQQQQPKPGEQSKDEKGDQSGKPAAAALDPPPSEQSLALDQWLRQIPDDPSGLLRRKFWIEHLRREQEARQ
jgi:Ca-activated chloride channel family protein